jgi:hypothetical protein
MSAAKKKESSSRGLAMLAWFFGAGRPLLILFMTIVVLGGAGYFLWQRVGPRVLSSPEYQVGPDQLEITPTPGWIHRDLRVEILRNPTLDGPLSLLDDDLAERIHNAFTQHPWVAKVLRVTKQPASIKIDLVYRRPVCMVEVPGGVFAVDAEGVLLPSEDFSPIEATRYPRLTGVERKPSGPPGRRWGDATVIGGAEIAAALMSAWEAMRLQSIAPLTDDATTATNQGENETTRRYQEPQFVLFTRGGTRIFWGYAPGANVVGELSATEKVARLQKYWTANDTLDVPQGQPSTLDIRNMSPKNAN